jgi:hypothetical protein
VFRLLTAVTALLLFPRPCPAPVIIMLDTSSDPKLTDAAWKDPRGAAQRALIDELTRDILRLGDEDRAAILGPDVGPLPPGKYDLPAGGYRSVTVSGLHVEGEPCRPETHHLLGDAGAVVLYFGFSDSPQTVVVYLRDGARHLSVDRRRVGPLAPDALVNRRLEWDGRQLDRVVRLFRARWRERFPHELDTEAERRGADPERSADVPAKLAAWVERGRRRGDRLDEADDGKGGRTYRWSDRAGRLVRRAVLPEQSPYRYTGWEEFVEYHPTGRPARREYGQRSKIWGVEWFREDGTPVRREAGSSEGGVWRPHEWAWVNPVGVPVRTEWDTNEDGVPDRYDDHDAGGLGPQRLSVPESWAVHPERIIPEFRTGDDRGLPVRPAPPAPAAEDEPVAEPGSNSGWVLWVLAGAAVILVAWLALRSTSARR